MLEFKTTLPNVKRPRIIKLEEHNPLWKEFFEREKVKIEQSFSQKAVELVDVLHVGSTSVEGLLAKPIIDIILVLKDPYHADEPLSEVGYKYKGEYNLPMRRMFGKQGEFEVYMHVYGEGNPEIELNRTFVDFLKSNMSAREEYSVLKKSIIAKDAAYKTTSIGITTYNLEKSKFIQESLKKAGFNGLCMRLCAQDCEWADYKLIRENSLARFRRSNGIDTDQNKKHIVLIKGIEIVAASQVNVSEPNAFIEFLGVKTQSDSRVMLLEHLLGNIEKWLGRLGTLFVTASVTQENRDIFKRAQYTEIAKKDSMLHMVKYLS